MPKETSPDEYLRQLCIKGLKERYEGNDEMLPGGELAQVVMDRLDRELRVIAKLGFSNYFLIVWDFVRHAREIGVPATARGSGVGALVCFATYLSHVCPIKYDLLFERFLDESRLEAPDIDIDFLSATAKRNYSVREGEVWRIERSADRYLWNDESQSGDQRRRTGHGIADGSGQSNHGNGSR